jgi:hypothetical protein
MGMVSAAGSGLLSVFCPSEDKKRQASRKGDERQTSTSRPIFWVVVLVVGVVLEGF